MSTERVAVGPLELSITRRGNGPPLLLIAGLGNSHTIWNALVEELPDVSTIAVDAPGMGRSSLPRRPLSMPQLAAVYGQLIQELGLERAAVLGFSFGGAVAQQLAHQSPELVERLILCGAGPGLGGVPGNPRSLQELTSPLRYYSMARLRRVSPGLYGGRRAREPDAFREEQKARVASPPSFQGYYYQLYALAGWSSLPWLSNLEPPTLVLLGDEDPIFPVENARLFGRRIPRVQVEVMPGSGHLFVIDEAENVAASIRAFLT